MKSRLIVWSLVMLIALLPLWLNLVDHFFPGFFGESKPTWLWNAFDWFIFWLGGISVLVIYMLPTILAITLGRSDSGIVAAVNLFLGWTILGWIVTAIWAALPQE
jgi:hypothetical protein